MLDTTQVLLINISRKIAFPALASLQQDPARITRAYFKLTRVSAALVLPTYVGLALAAPEIVLLLLGDRWSESGPVASVLFLIGPVLALQAFSSALFYAVGKPSVNFRLRLITMVVRVAGFFAAVPFGIVAVAAAFSVSGYVLLPLNLYWQHVHAGIPIRQYVRQLRGPAFATVAMAVAVVAAKAVLADVSEPEVVLSVEIALGAVAYLVALVLLDRRLVAEVLSIILQVIPGGSGLRRRFSRIPTGSPR
jgi:PST family polysaccharide transporter